METIGIQVGPDSFVDEEYRQRYLTYFSNVGNGLRYILVRSYIRGITGGKMPDKPLPGTACTNQPRNFFHGGNFAMLHSSIKTRALRREKLRAPQ